MTLASYFHDLDPIIFRISGDLAIRWYGLSYICGFIIAWALLYSLARQGKVLIPPERVGDALMWLIGGVIIGGRVGYCLFYERSLLVEFTSSPPFWGLFAINKGGMASHFGMVGCILASYRISRGWKTQDSIGNPIIVGRCSLRHILDALAIASPFGLLLGRLANFINGELLGRIIAPPGTPGPSWGVQFPQELSGWTAPGVIDKLSHTPPLSDAQQVALNALVKSVQQTLGPDSTFRAAIRYLIEHPARYKAELIPLLSTRHPSQLYQAAAEGIVVGLAAWISWSLFRLRAGVTAGVWLVVYGILRVVTEIWRLPDAQFGDAGRPLGLSRGQWFSVGMVVVGLGLLIYSATKPPRTGSAAAEQA